jgi:hypothetical protein
LRPGQHLGNTLTHVGGHPLDSDGPRHVETISHVSRPAERPRRASVGSVREFKGPERFFYDKSSYTGVHKKGGPITLDSSSWASTMRPGMH